MKTSFKLLISFIFVISGFLFLSQNALGFIPSDYDYNPDPTVYSYCPPDVERTCDNANTISGTNSCGVGCLSLCDDPAFNGGNPQDCRVKMVGTQPWGKYSAKSYTCTFINYNPRFSPTIEVFNYYLASAVCSTADKESIVGSSNDTQLKFGYCSCSPGNTYKSCCQAQPHIPQS